jgi:hypothetical protein
VFKTYVPSSRTWASLSNTPANVRVGGGLTYQPSNAVLTGTSYFALAGGNSKAFWKYTSAGGWSAMSNIPNNVGAGGGLTYIYSTTSQCSPGGYFVSSVKDTGKDSQVMNSIIWDEVIPNNPYANIKLETRISNTLVGGVPNAPWVTATTQATHTGAGTYYASLLGTTGRYVQYRVTMTTGDVTMASPALNEVRVYYLGI